MLFCCGITTAAIPVAERKAAGAHLACHTTESVWEELTSRQVVPPVRDELPQGGVRAVVGHVHCLAVRHDVTA